MCQYRQMMLSRWPTRVPGRVLPGPGPCQWSCDSCPGPGLTWSWLRYPSPPPPPSRPAELHWRWEFHTVSQQSPVFRRQDLNVHPRFHTIPYLYFHFLDNYKVICRLDAPHSQLCFISKFIWILNQGSENSSLLLYLSCLPCLVTCCGFLEKNLVIVFYALP